MRFHEGVNTFLLLNQSIGDDQGVGCCVIFVQHPLRFRGLGVFGTRSVVACASAIHHGDRATEGGIPRSSRFRWFA
jgi:hypothetical protein